eukprot:gene15617-biopygen18723
MAATAALAATRTPRLLRMASRLMCPWLRSVPGMVRCALEHPRRTPTSPRASVTPGEPGAAWDRQFKGQSSPSRPQEDRQISPSARFRRRMEETNIGS